MISIASQTAREKVILILLIVMLKIVLNWFYIQLSDFFQYYGIVLSPAVLSVRIVVWALLLLAALSVRAKAKKASEVIHSYFFLFIFLPTSVHVELNSTIGLEFYVGIASVFILLPLFSRLVSQANYLRYKSLNISSFYFLFGALFLLLMSILVLHFGFPLRIPTLSTIYEQRDVFHASAGRLEKYVFDWLLNSLNILLLIIALRKRLWLLVLLTLFFSVYLFSLGGHKGALLIWPFTTAIFFIYLVARERFAFVFTMILLAVMLLGLTYDAFFDVQYSSFSSILVRRGLLLPGQIYYYYCDFFSQNELNYFSHNVPFKYFLDSPYSRDIPKIIGSDYFRFKDGIYANGNVFADSFANIGFWSYPFLILTLSLFYAIVDWLSMHKDRFVLVAFLLVASHSFVNSGLLVSLVTHGLLLSMTFVFFYPKKNLAPAKSTK